MNALTRRTQVLVIGSDKDHCSKTAYDIAYQVGTEAAKRGVVVLTGGRGGVMEAASRGAKETGGFVIGIIPQDKMAAANPYCDAVIATGLGHARDFVTAYSADVIIIVEGGSGSMIELAAAYQKMIPVVAVRGSGGVADKMVDNYVDDRRLEIVHGEVSPEKAVETALQLVESIKPERHARDGIGF